MGSRPVSQFAGDQNRLMRPGIIAATPAEARILKKGPMRTGALMNLPYFFLFISGMGADRASRAAESLLAGGAQGLISWGTAGALAPALRSGTLILPEKVLGADRSVFSADPIWHAALRARLSPFPFQTGTLAESPVVLARAAEKSALRKETGAVAVDLESAAIARAAGERGVPFVAVRAILDEAEGDISAGILRSLDTFGRMRPFRLLRFLAGHPGEISCLLRLARNFQTARKTLSAVARRAGDRFQICQGREDHPARNGANS